MSKPADLVQGTLDLLLLKIVALEPLHAWAISQRLKQVSGEVLQVSDGSLYCTPQARTRRLDQGGVEGYGKRPACQVLFTHTPGPPCVGARGRQLGTAGGRDFSGRSTQRGINHA